jgi:hypothetical protein
LRLAPLFIRDRRFRALPGLLLLFAPALAAQQALPAPPDFSQDPIARAARDFAAAWTQWRSGDTGIEQKIYQLPMADARDLLQRSLGRYLDVLDARRAYSEALAAYIDSSRLQPRPGQPVATVEVVYRDQIDLLGVNLSVLQEKLDALRASNDWVAIRRAAQPGRTDLLALQSSRRADMPEDLSLDSPDHPRAPNAIAGQLYRDSEAKLLDSLEKLWTRYYQSLEDAVEQKPAGAATLVAVRGAAAAAPPGAAANAATPVAGNWTYVQGSQQFNGLGEPSGVLLELWVENGMLAGRYRAELPDFQGPRKIDIRLHGPLDTAANLQTLDFESKDPNGTGKVTLEFNPTRKELMFVRSSQTIIPRGRETLHPR